MSMGIIRSFCVVLARFGCTSVTRLTSVGQNSNTVDNLFGFMNNLAKLCDYFGHFWLSS